MDLFRPSLAAKYADLLQAMYGAKCQPQEKFLGELLKLLCGNQYELTVNHFKPDKDKPKQKHSVHVGLSYSREGSEWKDIQSKFKTEYERLDREAKQHRLDKARKEQGLKALQ